MTKVTIELDDAEHALQVLERLDVVSPTSRVIPSATTSRIWKTDLKNRIEAALLKIAENTWKPMSSFNDRDGVYVEINEFGEVRVEAKVYKPEFDPDVNAYYTTFIDQLGEEHDIDPVYFVRSHFNKELVL